MKKVVLVFLLALASIMLVAIPSTAGPITPVMESASFYAVTVDRLAAYLAAVPMMAVLLILGFAGMVARFRYTYIPKASDHFHGLARDQDSTA